MKLDPKAAGTHLGGFAEKTLANWRSSGEGPPFFKVGGKVFYEQDDLDAWLASRRRTSTSQTEQQSAG